MDDKAEMERWAEEEEKPLLVRWVLAGVKRKYLTAYENYFKHDLKWRYEHRNTLLENLERFEKTGVI